MILSIFRNRGGLTAHPGFYMAAGSAGGEAATFKFP